MKLSLPIQLVLLFVSLVASAQQIDYQFRHLTVEDGLTHTDATCVAQDTNGFMWIGTYYGLNRFDGYEMKSYVIENQSTLSAYKNRINAMCIDGNNRIWLATQGGVECFDITKEKFVSLSLDQPNEAIQEDVRHIHASPDGQLIFANKRGLFAYQINLDNSITKIDLPKRLDQLMVFSIQRDFEGNFWVGSGRTLTYLSKDLSQVEEVKVYDQYDNRLPTVGDLFFADPNKIWIASNDKISQASPKNLDLNRKRLTVKSIDLKDLVAAENTQLYDTDIQKINITRIVDDRRGNLWLGTEQGLFQYTPDAQHALKFYYSSYPPSRYVLTSRHINNLFVDYSKCLWVSTFGGGVNYIDLKQKQFHLLQVDPQSTRPTLSGNYIRALQEDSNGNLWIGTRENGLNHYNFETGTYKHYTEQSGINSNNIRSLAYDAEQRLWVGTNDGGINIHNPNTDSFHQITTSEGLSNNTIFTIAKDKFGQMWAGSWLNGLNRIQYEDSNSYSIEKVFEDKSKHPISSNRISFIYADDEYPEVFLGTDKGLDRIYLNEDGSIQRIVAYKGEDGTTTSLSSNFIWPIIRENEHTLWIGTIGGGLNKITLLEGDAFEAQHFSIEEGAPSADIESMAKDAYGRIWMGTKGISMFDPNTNKFRNFDVNDGLQSNSFKIGAAFKGASGRLYFGGTRGINFFHPDSIALNEQKPKVVLTDLIVNNAAVHLGEVYSKWPLLENSINETEHVRLSYLENNFAFTFASPYFANPGKCRYRYMLEGFDQDWVYTDANDRKATYSNLDFGDYTFKVSASSGDGIWGEEITSLQVSVVAPWWRTTLAYIIYILLFLSVLGAIYYALIRWYKLKQAYEITLLEEKKTEEIHQMRLQFFTNISHDFKTPLSLILNPLENLLNEKIGERKAKRYYHLMHNNAKRLLHLVNELMDFRKVETGAYQLKVHQADIHSASEQVIENFKEHALSKDIKLSFETTFQDHFCYFDKNVLEKSLVNLIGNAFKNTGPMGTIKIQLFNHYEQFKPSYQQSYKIKSEYCAETYTWIHVQDTGSGIPKDHLPLIFDRYFTDNKGKARESGSGVGLALVKSLVLMHKGEISVYSDLGKGTEFLIGLPNDAMAYEGVPKTVGEQLNTPSLSKSQAWLEEKSTNASTPRTNENISKLKLLIVEDNHDLRNFIKESFDQDYQVFEAIDGKEGLELAQKIIPEVIISDVMMPKLDGVSFCQKVKENETLNHIPFILLTAKSSEESKIEGVESGADYYFTKPISIRILKATIHNIMATRNKLKTLYMQNAFSKARELTINHKEKAFMEEFVQIIEQNIERTDFDVDQLCKEIGMSRTKLYNKVKSITGKSVGEFIRGLRLKRAAEILASEDISIVQVMYRVGIQSQSYFTKSFKKGYGKTPTQFVNDLSRKSKSLVE